MRLRISIGNLSSGDSVELRSILGESQLEGRHGRRYAHMALIAAVLGRPKACDFLRVLSVRSGSELSKDEPRFGILTV